MSCVHGIVSESVCICDRFYRGGRCTESFFDYWHEYFVLYPGLFFVLFFVLNVWICFEMT
jgi:hypothetical protein